MKSYRLFITVLLLSFTLLMSCSKDEDNPTEPGNGENNGNTNNSGQPIPTVAQSGDGVLATISYEFQTVPGFPAAALTMGFAQFGDGIDGGNVSVNSNSLGKTSQSGTTFYISPSPSNPTQSLTGVSFDGSNHNWQVSGSGNVSQISGAVKSPTNFTVSNPASNATLSKASGITVNWNNTSANSQVLIVLAPINNSGSYYSAETNDNGSYTIASGDLNSFSGECLLQVVKFNYSTASSGGKTYYLIAEIVKSVTITVN